MSELEIVNITKSLASTIKQVKVKEQIVNRIRELKLDNAEFKNKQEILLLICNLIEYLIKKADKISKRDLAIQVITEVYTLNAVERATFESNIDFLASTSMIKKVSSWKLFCTGVVEWFSSKKK